MQKRDMEANTFYRLILHPDEEPGFVSDEAALRDVTLAPDEEILKRVQEHYGLTLHSSDFQKPFWSLLDQLETKPSSTAQ